MYALADAGKHGVCWVRRVGTTRALARAALSAPIFAFALAACAVGPDYKPAAAPVSTKFKELKGWKLAAPSDALDRGNWWSLYRDSKLDSLLRQVEVSNQTVAMQAAAYEQTRAVIREAQSALFPTLTANYNATRTRTGPNAGSGGNGASGLSSVAGLGSGAASGAIYTTTFVPQLSASWDLDVWGKVRRQIEANTSAGQADPYLDVSFRQPIPASFLAGHMEILMDLRNLLAQGYVPVMGQDGHTLYLVQSARSVRGGVAFSF